MSRFIAFGTSNSGSFSLDTGNTEYEAAINFYKKTKRMPLGILTKFEFQISQKRSNSANLKRVSAGIGG